MPINDHCLVWVDGVSQNFLSTTDRGLAYGDGVFETIRITSGKVTLADYHWSRLYESCQTLNLPLDITLLQKEVVKFLASEEASPIVVKGAVLKVIITRGSGGRGYSPEGCLQSRRILSLHHLPKRTPDPAYAGAKVKACELRLGMSDLAGMKHLNRLEQVMARAEWQGWEFDEGLICNFHGELVEGTMSNLFLVSHDQQLLTPDLKWSGVKGVCRQFILDNASYWGLSVGCTAIKPTDLDVAELFLCNSVNGAWPVVQYGEWAWEIGPITIMIRDRILEAFDV